ncbi:hypothetical protein [Dyadobacter sp. NIV53]|uniref:hypothetical protein n=1 Tax=Dyadobacter sp. NIV53 TaxID=2861765 RepID=UPI001C878E2C|nr:hypothetical protein [Dyadobacter sp. NIV53]
MDQKDTLKVEIMDAIVSRLEQSYELSDKAKRRITKSAAKLADRLFEIFQKQERKAARKAGEMKDDLQSTGEINPADEQDDLH